MAKVSKVSLFRGTIAVLVAYIVLVAAVLALIFLQPGGIGASLTTDLALFTVLLVVGTVVIAGLLVRAVINYNATMTFVPVSAIACPDYYTLTTDDSTTNFTQKYTCTSNTKVYASPNPISDPTLLQTGAFPNSDCASFYPVTLINNEGSSPFKNRMLFSNECSVPWTDLDGNFALSRYNVTLETAEEGS